MVIEPFHYFESLIHYLDKVCLNLEVVANDEIDLKRLVSSIQAYTSFLELT